MSSIGPQKRLLNRRIEMYTRHLHGEPHNVIIREMAGKYGVTDSAMWADWKKRHTWGDFVIPEIEDDFVVQDYLNGLEEVERHLWEIALDPRAPAKDRVAALSQLGNMKFKALEMNQSLGRVHLEPMQITVKEEVNKLYEAVKQAAGPDVKTQKMVVRALMKYQHANGDNEASTSQN